MPETARDAELLLQLAGSVVETLTVPTFQVAAGATVVLVSPQAEATARLLRQLLGLEPLAHGAVQLFGQDLAALDERVCSRLRQRVGLVASGGGLVSNLKVLENLMLPALYHRQLSRAEAEAKAMRLLERVGYDEHPMRLPGLLTLLQKKQVSLARAMMLDPELMIYDRLAFGLTAFERDRLLALTEAFHGERAGRASLYLTSDRKLAERSATATVITLHAGAIS